MENSHTNVRYWRGCLAIEFVTLARRGNVIYLLFCMSHQGEKHALFYCNIFKC